MSSLQLLLLASGTPWVPHRNARLNAWALVQRLRPHAHVLERVVADKASAGALRAWLIERREVLAKDGRPVDRFDEEGYILAFEAKLKAEGRPKLTPREHLSFREVEARDICLGLDVKTELFEVWQQCAARCHARPVRDIPPSVKLILTGCRNLEMVEEDVAILLDDDRYLLRRRNLPQGPLAALRETVIHQWVAASGGLQRHLDRAAKMLGMDKDQRLLELANAGGYVKLAPEMADIALQLAEGDARLAFFVFRCMQRVAACTVDGDAMWVAEWLRGAKAHVHAIPGATGKPKLVDIVQEHILGEVVKGHSGAAAIPTTFTIKLAVQLGAWGPDEAAKRLGLTLNSKGLPRR